MKKSFGVLLVSAFTLTGAARVFAQTPPPAQNPNPPLEVGAVAPDFELPGATRYGVLANPVRLSDYKGKTIVLAFFFKARTKG